MRRRRRGTGALLPSRTSPAPVDTSAAFQLRADAAAWAERFRRKVVVTLSDHE